jgi:plasmid stabilization system protein ParE
MEYNVFLSERARLDIEETANYLSENWSEKVKMDFLVRVTENIQRIAEMPYLFRSSPKGNFIRECVLDKHHILYYRINDDTIEIITIRSSRENPDQ